MARVKTKPTALVTDKPLYLACCEDAANSKIIRKDEVVDVDDGPWFLLGLDGQWHALAGICPFCKKNI